MGLLDDAIREHLELKRRHGASDEEISQQEAEALGPARRDFPQPAAAEEGQSAEPEPDAEPADAVEDPLPEAIEDLPTAVEPPPAEPEPEPESEDRDLGAGNSELAADEEDEDVLEETPEFLQDAPEHDRLWFEQKPPRDFDFE
jgi:hypothetical protein